MIFDQTIIISNDFFSLKNSLRKALHQLATEREGGQMLYELIEVMGIRT